MARDPIQALVFDIGQVIVRVDANRAAEGLASSVGSTVGEILSAIRTDPGFLEFQEGRLAPHGWYEHLRCRLGFAYSFEQFQQVWASALVPEPILDEALFRQLARRHRLILLSNTDPIHVAHLREHFGLLRYFRARVFSCDVGTSKPAAAIYRAAISAARVEPRFIHYIDDVPEYVESGRRAGMQTHLFEGAGSLLADLRARKILPPSDCSVDFR